MSAFVAIFLPLLLAYAVALRWIWDIWMLPESYYSHGPLLPAVAAYVIWQRRAQWQPTPAEHDRGGWWLLAPGLAAHFAGALLMIDSLSAASLVLAVPGAVWLALGRQRARILLPAFGLVLLAVPLPLFATGSIAFELKEFAVQGGVAVARGLGLAVVREGANLHVPAHTEALLVEDPCGGLRSLLALTTLGYCFAFVLAGGGRWRWLLLAVSVPLAIGLNVLRIAFLCYASQWWGASTASTSAHDWANAAVWLLAIAVLIGMDRRLGGGRP